MIVEDLSQVRVPAGNTLAIVVSLIIAVGLPFALMIIWKKKTGAKIYPFFIGMGTFMVFALLLEQLMHIFVLEATGTLLSDNVFLYSLYGGLAAGIFEETGRFVVMKLFLNKNGALSKQNSVMYGFGHGGFESIMILGMTEISNLIMVITLNSGLGGMLTEALRPEEAAIAIESIRGLWEYSPFVFLAGAIERIGAIALHVCLSYVVYRAIKDRKVYLYFVAIGIHALVDFVTALLAKSGVSTVLIEVALYVMVIVMGFFVIKAYKAEKESVDEDKSAATVE